MNLALDEYHKYIAAALEHAGGTHLVEDVVEMVAAGRLQAWTGDDSIIITELIDYPRKRVLHVFLAGGNLAGIEAMHDGIIEWSKTQGCTAASLVGRPGWARSFLARRGWQPTLQILDKEY